LIFYGRIVINCGAVTHECGVCCHILSMWKTLCC